MGSTAALQKSHEVVLEVLSFVGQGMMSSKNLKVVLKIWACYQGHLDSTSIAVHADMIHASLERVLMLFSQELCRMRHNIYTYLYHSIPITYHCTECIYSYPLDVDVMYPVSLLSFPFRVSKHGPRMFTGKPLSSVKTMSLYTYYDYR